MPTSRLLAVLLVIGLGVALLLSLRDEPPAPIQRAAAHVGMARKSVAGVVNKVDTIRSTFYASDTVWTHVTAVADSMDRHVDTLLAHGDTSGALMTSRAENDTLRAEVNRQASVIRVANVALGAIRDTLQSVTSRLDSARADLAAAAREPRVTRWAGIGYDPMGRYATLSGGMNVNIWKGVGADLYVERPLIREEDGGRVYATLSLGYFRTF